MQLVSESLATASTRQPDEVAEGLTSLFDDRDLIAVRLTTAIDENLRTRVTTLHLPETVEFHVRRQRQFHWVEAEGWRVPDVSILVLVRISSRQIHRAEARFQVFIAIDPDSPFAFRLTASGSTDSLDVRLEDTDPELRSFLRLRLSQWIDRQLARLLAELRAA